MFEPWKVKMVKRLIFQSICTITYPDLLGLWLANAMHCLCKMTQSVRNYILTEPVGTRANLGKRGRCLRVGRAVRAFEI